jgi:hypothetical protein
VEVPVGMMETCVVMNAKDKRKRRGPLSRSIFLSPNPSLYRKPNLIRFRLLSLDKQPFVSLFTMPSVNMDQIRFYTPQEIKSKAGDSVARDRQAPAERDKLRCHDPLSGGGGDYFINIYEPLHGQK